MIAGRKREENQFELVSKEKNKSEKTNVHSEFLTPRENMRGVTVD